MAVDLVCGMDVKKSGEYTLAYGGKIFYFCSGVCLAEFKRMPDKYLDELHGERAVAVYELLRLMAKTFYRTGRRGEVFEDLTQGEIFAVEALGRLGRCKMSVLSRECGLGLTTMTGIMDRLVDKGYARRDRSQEDRRAVYTELTAKGKRTYSQLMASNMEAVITALNALDPEEQKRLASFSRKILEHFQ